MDKILTLVRARYPMLQLVSHEEERVAQGVDRLPADEIASIGGRQPPPRGA